MVPQLWTADFYISLSGEHDGKPECSELSSWVVQINRPGRRNARRKLICISSGLIGLSGPHLVAIRFFVRHFTTCLDREI